MAPLGSDANENFDSFSFLEENRVGLKNDMHKVLVQAMPDSLCRQGGLDTEKFMKELFEEKLEVDSCFSTGQNMHYVNKAIEESRPKNKAIADLQERTRPAWFSIPKHNSKIEPSDMAEIDFLRDLGPNARKVIKSNKDKQIKKIQKYVLDNM